MHERPELHHIVLKRSSCQQKPSLSVKSEKSLPSLRPEIFDILSFIKDHVVPLLSSKCKVILDNKLVTGNADVERVLL